MKYYLGLDNGGSNTKAAMEEKWLMNCEVIKGLLKEQKICAEISRWFFQGKNIRMFMKKNTGCI